MKIENSKLRRANDKLQGNFASQLKLVAQLESQVEKFNDDQTINNYEVKIAEFQKKIENLEKILEEKNTNEMRKSLKKVENYHENIDSNTNHFEAVDVEM